jgi:hypothetical protein
MGAPIVKVIGGVEDTPIAGAPGIAESIKPGFLNGDDVPICGVSCIKYILMCHF